MSSDDAGKPARAADSSPPTDGLGPTSESTSSDPGGSPSTVQTKRREDDDRDDKTPDVDDLIAEYDEERPSRRLSPKLDQALTLLCFIASAFVLYQVFFPLPQGNQFYLILFLAAVLPLVYLTYRIRKRAPGDRGGSDNPSVLDWVLAAVTLIVCLYPVLPISFGDSGGGFNAFLDRQGILTTTDIIMGAVLMILLLEACRRTTGLVLPIVCLVFFGYAYYGGFLPVSWPISHSGIDFGQIINGFYNDGSGFYGTPLDVCATYIVLFTIYGAVLEATGAGRFFIDISFATFRKSKTAPGRTVALSGFLLGTVSGSGTATAVSLGSVAWPILKKAGYPRNNAGGMLAASGIGAILSPPTLGAAAFIIAEYLQTSYLEVLLWATIPTILYYTGIILAVEIDARRFGAKEVDIPTRNPWKLLGRFGYHFLSLGIIVLFLALDIPPFKAVVYATLVAALFGLAERVVSKCDPLDPDSTPVALPEALKTYAVDLYRALSKGIRSALPVATVCASAGIITSVIVKTGLGQNLADILVKGAEALGNNPTAVLILTAVFAALAILILGLAVPVTASFIISWVVIGPALQTLGVSGPETAMFIFYYAVLSEVSPPTALAAVASAAITGGNSIKTMWQAAKYTLPAFLAPLAFIITQNGSHLLMFGSFTSILWVTAVSMVAVASLAIVTGGWIFGPANVLQRALCVPAALLLLYLQPLSIGIGLAFLAVAIALNFIGRNKTPQIARSPLTT